ncbi:RES family NAD+ phosphorylase [Mucilaginibacter sp. RCC_168]|uniref:RES family NAD+ phosphorylase n=1 Tax=Mucilaginibacter sp. RCC_168 TaxID=3239221 RepID=UPI003525C9FF
MSFPIDGNIPLKHTCHYCVGEKFLNAEISSKGKKRNCAYCGRSAKGYRLGEIAERVDTAFQIFHIRTSDEMDSMEERMHFDRESDYNWERSGEQVIDAIAIAIEAENEIAEDIQAVLEDKYYDHSSAEIGEETEYASDSYYTTKSLEDKSWQQEWAKFEKSLKTENRFFNHAGAKHLTEIFTGLEETKTDKKSPIVIKVGGDHPISSIFRARVFQSDEKLTEALKRPELHLGPPPSAFASNGRMNARGISVFYGAEDEDTALAEIRPSVGSQVAVANFKIIRELKMLDLRSFGDIKIAGSIFDPAFARQLAKVAFLDELSQQLTRPIMPDDELFEYLPTQAISDFLATEPSFNFDGIIFPSAQVEGVHANLVLFNKAARVREKALPKGTDSDVRLTEWDMDRVNPVYSVMEWVPEPGDETKKETSLFEDLYGYAPEKIDPDKRPVTLEIDVESLAVHVINSVKVNSERHSVSRTRYGPDEITDE